ncbi:MAG TPA: hypothetical protein VIK64_15790 [Anaerolineales bacterium]
MEQLRVQLQGSMFMRILWLYGLFTLFSNAAYLVAYYWLPEGFMRGSPQAAAARIASKPDEFWSEFGLTLFFNLGVMSLIILLSNFSQVRGFPAAYLIPIFLGITGGLVTGSNSFIADDLDRYSSVREAIALGLTIGEIEMLGYILMIAATVKFGVYQYKSWWRWSGEWKPVKVMRIRDVRLSKAEIICLGAGFLFLIIAAYRETVMAMSL